MNPPEFADAIADQCHELYGPSRLEVPMSALGTAVLRQHLVVPAQENTAPEGIPSGQQGGWEAATHLWPLAAPAAVSRGSPPGEPPQPSPVGRAARSENSIR